MLIGDNSSPNTRASMPLLARMWLVNAWVVTATVLLIIPMDKYGELQLLSRPEQSLMRIIVFGTLLLLVIMFTYLGGKLIDRSPVLINVEAMLGFIFNLVGLYFYSQLESLALLVVGLFSIGIGSSLLSVSAFTALGISTSAKKRGITIALTMVGSLLFLLTLISLRSLFSQVQAFRQLGYVGASNEVIVLHGTIVLGVIGLIFTGIMLLFKGLVRWQVDQWPTPDKKIINRSSVQLYFLAHLLIYVILGISVGVIAKYGTDLGLVTTFLGLQVAAREAFWFFIVLGDVSLIIPLGKLSDKKGRKPVALASIYLLAIAVLGLSSIPVDILINNHWLFFITGFLVGMSFAGIHVTLDSSTWYDLSPNDSMGRYVALGLISLIVGLGTGRLIGLNIAFSRLFDFTLLGYLMLFVIVIVLLPLNLVDDSYPPLQFILLLVRLKGGLLMFSHDFGRQRVDQNRLDLISGALEAIDTFMHEVLEEGYLRLVQHSTFYILNDGYKDIRVNLICNKSKKEIKDTLHHFTVAFHEQFKDVIATWSGTVGAFNEANQLVENIFGPLMVEFT